MPLVKRTRAIFLNAEFGFLGVVVVTFTHTPLLKGEGKKTGLFFLVLKLRQRAGAFGFFFGFFLGFLINCCIVAIIQ